VTVKEKNEEFRLAVKCYFDNNRGLISRFAHKINIKEAKFRSKLAGRVAFQVGEAIAIIEHLQDQTLADVLLGNSSFIASRQEDLVSESSASCMMSGAVDANLGAADVLKEVNESVADGKIDAGERGKIKAAIASTVRKLGRLRQLVLKKSDTVDAAG